MELVTLKEEEEKFELAGLFPYHMSLPPCHDIAERPSLDARNLVLDFQASTL